MKAKTTLLISAMFMTATLRSLGQPSITLQPANQTANQGFSATFRAVAQGTAPLIYEWFFQSNAIPSAANNVLTITNAQPVNAGGYYVVVTNSTGSVTSRVATLTVILPVPLDPKLSANIRLGEDSPSLPVTYPHQAEPHIARSYLDPNLLIASFQDGAGPHPIGDDTLACGYSVSTNGGLTWTRDFIPGLSQFNGGAYQGAADNVAAIDLQGNVFVASLIYSNKIGGGYVSEMVINKSVDASKMLGPPRLAAPANSAYYADKAGPSHLELALSKDGGETFDPSLLVKDLTGNYYDDPIAASPGFPTACTDRQAGVIYVAVQAWVGSGTNRAPRILFTKSIDQGKTWSTAVPVNDTPARKSVFFPGIAVSPDGQHVTIEFYDKRNDPGSGYFVDLYLAESFDGGATWEPNIRLSDFSSDLRKAPTMRSRPWLGDYQAIVPALNFQTPGVAVWIDTRSGNNDTYVVRINRTKGTTFDTWRKLRFSTNDLANLAISGENGDLDGDHIPNLAEYAFGLESTRADVSPLKIAAIIPGPNASMTVSYERLAVLSDIQFSWQTSVNLVDWTPVSPALEQVAAGRDPSMQRVETSYSAGDQTKFFRLSVSQIDPAP